MRTIERPGAVDPLRRRRLLGSAAAIAVAGVEAVSSTGARARLPRDGALPSFDGATAWLNTAPLTPAALRGRVVLVDFWTLTCINWLRTLPYVRAWAEKYAEQGLTVIGVHTPEFTFEQDVDTVRRAAKDLEIGYPIAVDSDQAIWRAFDNRYWPALYFVDARGTIRHHYFGEGEYERSERILRELLAEAGGAPRQGMVSVNPRGVEAAADWRSVRSPETYIGYARTANFKSPGGLRKDVPSSYRAVTFLPLNAWSLAGTWTVGSECAALNSAGGGIACRFHARDLHLVLAPAAAGRTIRFRVRLDGAPPGVDRGVDIDADGRGILDAGRLYQLIRQTRSVAERTFEIDFLDEGVRAYALTFG